MLRCNDEDFEILVFLSRQGRLNNNVICCANNHIQYLVCNESNNLSNHEACLILFSGTLAII